MDAVAKKNTLSCKETNLGRPACTSVINNYIQLIIRKINYIYSYAIYTREYQNLKLSSNELRTLRTWHEYSKHCTILVYNITVTSAHSSVGFLETKTCNMRNDRIRTPARRLLGKSQRKHINNCSPCLKLLCKTFRHAEKRAQGCVYLATRLPPVGNTQRILFSARFAATV
jgi:hypothetical protein